MPASPREMPPHMDLSTAEIFRFINSVPTRPGIGQLSSVPSSSSAGSQWSPRRPRTTLTEATPSDHSYISSNTQHVPSTAASSSRYTTHTSARTMSTAPTTTVGDEDDDDDGFDNDGGSEGVEEAENGTNSGNVVFPCEFSWYTGCQITFTTTQFDAWFHHIAEYHMRLRLPQASICWYCDGEVFRAQSRNQEDLRASFSARLRHIARHLNGELDQGPVRPDYWFLKHIQSLGLVGDDFVEMAGSWHEMVIPPWLNTTPIPKAVDRGMTTVERPGGRRARKSQTYRP